MNIFLFFLLGESGDKKAEDGGKWRFERGRSGGLRSLALPFAALSYQPGQHCVVELVLSVILRNSPFGLLPCFHIALESLKKVAMHPFLWNVIYWSLKWAFFFTCISRATSWDQFISFHMFLYWYVKSTIFIIPVLTRQFIHTGSCSSLQGSCWPLRFT